MPVSCSGHISHCIAHIITCAPQSVLDVGCGFGLWGFLCRMYLDVMPERVQPPDWKIRIDGIEIHAPYIQAHQRSLYNHVHIADICEMAPQLDPYDLIIAGDVIEHLDKDDGETVLRTLYGKARKALLVNIPLGAGWEHGIVHDNPGELHRSQWEYEDFAPYPNRFQAFETPLGQRYGVFFCPKTCLPKDRAEGLMTAAAWCESRGELERATVHLSDAQAIVPEDRGLAMQAAELLLRQGKTNEAVMALDRCIDADAAFHYGRCAAARILAAAGKYADAVRRFESLLILPNLDSELRDQVELALRQLRDKTPRSQ